MLHHSAQELNFIVDAARRYSLPHRWADLLAAFLLILADEFEVDSTKLNASTDKFFDLPEHPLFACDCPVSVGRGLPVEIHRGSLPEGQPTLILRPGTPFLD